MNVWPQRLGPEPAAGCADRQQILWSPTGWRENIARSIRRTGLDEAEGRVLLEAIAALGAACENLEGKDRHPLVGISRETVRALAERGDYRLLWLATLIWGYGGPFRSHLVAKGWFQRDLEERVERIASEARKGPAAVFAAHAGGFRPYGMRVAMGSKLWHFAAGTGAGGVTPQIYDENVRLALTSAHVLDRDWPTPARIDARSYVQWCTWAHDIAGDLGGDTAPEDVEVAVFKAGRRLRRGDA